MRTSLRTFAHGMSDGHQIGRHSSLPHPGLPRPVEYFNMRGINERSCACKEGTCHFTFRHSPVACTPVKAAPRSRLHSGPGYLDQGPSCVDPGSHCLDHSPYSPAILILIQTVLILVQTALTLVQTALILVQTASNIGPHSLEPWSRQL